MPFHPLKTLLKSFGIAAVSAAISFFLGIFLTLIIQLLYSYFSGAKPDLTISYRIVGLGLAIAAFVIGFTITVVIDLRKIVLRKTDLR